jgi:hypothetical protein
MPQSISEQNRWRPFHAAGHGGAQRLGCVQRLVRAVTVWSTVDSRLVEAACVAVQSLRG